MQYPTIPLSEVEEQWLHAWRELDMISQGAYDEEIERRQALEKAPKADAVVYQLRPAVERHKRNPPRL